MSTSIYLDNNASTALDARVIEAMVAELHRAPSNPSSRHDKGREAHEILERCRKQVADYLKVKPEEILFTSGGTEALNMALRGIYSREKSSGTPREIITSRAEHAAVRTTVNALTKESGRAIFLNTGPKGYIAAHELEEAITAHTALISLMAVNNETGVKTDIGAIAAVAQKQRIPLVVDGVALMGKEPFTIPEGVTAMAFSGHKFHAPQGSGILYLKATEEIIPLMTGGGQEFGRRAGTENLPAIVGIAEAVNILYSELPAASMRMKKLRNRLEEGLKSQIEDLRVIGYDPNNPDNRVVNTSCVAFVGIPRESLFALLNEDKIYASIGSACFPSLHEPSSVLVSMDIPREVASSAIRFSLSRLTTEEEIDLAIKRIRALAKKCYSLVT